MEIKECKNVGVSRKKKEEKGNLTIGTTGTESIYLIKQGKNGLPASSA